MSTGISQSEEQKSLPLITVPHRNPCLLYFLMKQICY